MNSFWSSILIWPKVLSSHVSNGSAQKIYQLTLFQVYQQGEWESDYWSTNTWSGRLHARCALFLGSPSYFYNILVSTVFGAYVCKCIAQLCLLLRVGVRHCFIIIGISSIWTISCLFLSQWITTIDPFMSMWSLLLRRVVDILVLLVVYVVFQSLWEELGYRNIKTYIFISLSRSVLLLGLFM